MAEKIAAALSPFEAARREVLARPFRDETWAADLSERLDCPSVDQTFDQRCNRAAHDDTTSHMSVSTDGTRVWLVWP